MGETKYVRFYMRCTDLSALILSIVATVTILAAIIGPFAIFASAQASASETSVAVEPARNPLSRVVPRD